MESTITQNGALYDNMALPKPVGASRRRISTAQQITQIAEIAPSWLWTPADRKIRPKEICYT
jgi:hypothetical protein